MPPENQNPTPSSTARQGTTPPPASGGTKGNTPQPEPIKTSPDAPNPPVREPGKDPNKPKSAAGPEGLDGMLRIIRSVGQALLLGGNVTKHEAPLDGVLRAVYLVVREGERAIEAVQQTNGEHEKLSVPVPAFSDLPEWPEAGKDAQDTMEAAWGVLRPWLGELVERLPGSSERQVVVKLWITNCLLQWKELVGGISDALKQPSAPTETKASA